MAVRKNQYAQEKVEAREQRISVVREAGGILLLCLTALLLLSLLSYHASDPSFNHSGMAKARNLAGSAGAHLADLLLTGFGFGAGWIPFITGFIGLRMFRKLDSELYWDRIVATPVLVMATCILGALFTTPGSSHGLPAGAGGLIGQIAALHMQYGFGLWGSLILLGTLLLLCLMVVLRFSIVELLGGTLDASQQVGTHLDRSANLATGFWVRWRERRKRAEEREQRRKQEPPMEERPQPVIALSDPPLELPTPPPPASSGEPPVRREPRIERKPPPPPPPQPKLPFDIEELANIEAEHPLPPLSLLDRPEPTQTSVQDKESMAMKARILEKKLEDFGVRGMIQEVRPGPVVTTFELDPAPGLKAAKVIGLADDLARSITAVSVRVVGNIPGKSVIGIEIPNDRRQTVYLRDILESQEFKRSKSPLAVALGSDISGAPVVGDLARMPHLLIAGTTGSGKSVAVNAMLCSILFSATPAQVRFLMVDPKMLELSIYEGIPHLLSPVVTDVKKAANLLKWAVAEMEERYKLMSEMGVRNLAGFNQRVEECLKNGERPTHRVKTGFDPETGKPIEEEQPIPLESKPLIVIIIDELADLMIQVGKEVEPAIARLAQMARAAGLHLVLATQRPSVDVITGLIKANFPTRLAFQVASRIDSRTILDSMGAESLLGKGDGLYLPPGTSQMIRIHAPWVADNEVHHLVQFLKRTGKPAYNPEVLLNRPDGESSGGSGGDEEEGLEDAENDPYYDQAVAFVLKNRKVSASLVQRQFKIGYNRASRIVEKMELAGLVSEANTTGKREVLVPKREE